MYNVYKKSIVLVLLIIVFIVLQIFAANSNDKYTISYNIKEFLINEEYNYKIKNTYYLNIIYRDNVYSYQFHSSYLGTKIITDVKYYDDDKYECILPLFNNEIIFDIMCSAKKDGINYIYLHNMEDISDELNTFSLSIKEYDINKYKYMGNISEKIDVYDIYNKNISIETYRGIINGNKKHDLFDSDKYNKLSIYTDNYYVVPTYESEYGFDELYIINLKNNKLKTLKLPSELSYSSYVQGVDGDTVYIYDVENKKQYKLDCKKYNFNKIGDLSNNIKIYIDGKWEEKSVSDISDKKIIFDFKNYRLQLNDNTYMDTINDYIYTYIKNDNGYSVYKSNKYTPNLKNYLFDINDIDSVIYDGDYFYFKKDNYIGCYSEIEGIKKIIQSNELLFNKNILYKII